MSPVYWWVMLVLVVIVGSLSLISQVHELLKDRR